MLIAFSCFTFFFVNHLFGWNLVYMVFKNSFCLNLKAWKECIQDPFIYYCFQVSHLLMLGNNSTHSIQSYLPRSLHDCLRLHTCVLSEKETVKEIIFSIDERSIICFKQFLYWWKNMCFKQKGSSEPCFMDLHILLLVS